MPSDVGIQLDAGSSKKAFNNQTSNDYKWWIGKTNKKFYFPKSILKKINPNIDVIVKG